MKTAETRLLISKMRNKDLDEKKKRLEYIGRSIPYGYLKLNKQLISDVQTSHIVYLIYDLYDKGCSYTQIADYLNERGIVSPSYYKISGKYIHPIDDDANKKWQRGAVRKILHNKVYNGSYLYTTEKTHESLINDYLFNRVQLRTKEKKNYAGVDFYYHNGNIFSNKVYCKECGRVLTVSPTSSTKGMVNYLRCSSCDKRGDKKVECKNKKTIKYDELMNIVSMFLENEIYCNINFNDLENMYEKSLKESNIELHRKYLKQERLLIKKELDILNSNEIIGNDLIKEIRLNKQKQLIQLYSDRLYEIETLLKEIYSFARTKNISNKELYLDKYVIENFIDKITVGSLIDFKREISIVLK